MTLLLTLEQGPRNQAVGEARLEEGELVIGRSPEADWQIDDPDMFVSRAHCRIAAKPEGYFITDTSSSGLFIDDASSSLGQGNSARLHNGMRLRLGDYTVGVEVRAETPRNAAMPMPASARPRIAPLPTPASNPPPAASLGHDDFFSVRIAEEPPPPRPTDLPNPFEHPVAGSFQEFERKDASRGNSLAFDDPFSLDPVAGSPPQTAPRMPPATPLAFDDPFGLDASGPSLVPAQQPLPNSARAPFEDAVEIRPVPAAPVVQPTPDESSRANAIRASPPWELPETVPEPPAVTPLPAPVAASQRPRIKEPETAAAPRVAAGDEGLRQAFMRGLGLDAGEVASKDALADMEKFGREYRLMMQGLMQLLRKRAEEKSNARVAQTVVGASEVNPLKFLPTVDDALSTILTGRSPGFLQGEAAIEDAVRDLAQHHVRAWRGVQGALRSMIDRFDPASIEEELKTGSSIGTLLTGGRGSKLWELYQKRHRDIATSAESRFLGEIGADFRDAYEEE